MRTPRMVPPKLTVGLDLGDHYTALCALDEHGQVVATARLRGREAQLRITKRGDAMLRRLLVSGAQYDQRWSPLWGLTTPGLGLI